jgi:hypothetical protein
MQAPRIILLAHEGETNEQLADQLQTRAARVSKWRQRFGKQRMLVWVTPHGPEYAKDDQSTAKRMLALLDELP